MLKYYGLTMDALEAQAREWRAWRILRVREEFALRNKVISMTEFAKRHGLLMEPPEAPERQMYLAAARARFEAMDWRALRFSMEEAKALSKDPLLRDGAGDVFHLHLELIGSDGEGMAPEDYADLLELAKAERSISRDVLVPADMTLHATHYMIQALFGWRNSLYHKFELEEADFDALTAGRLSLYLDLCGVLFRFCDGNSIDENWDDDNGSCELWKLWFRRKMSRPYLNLGLCDAWLDIRDRVKAYREEFRPKPDSFLADAAVNSSLEKDVNALLERLRLRELLALFGDGENLPVRPSLRSWKGNLMYQSARLLGKWMAADQDAIQAKLSAPPIWSSFLRDWRSLLVPELAKATKAARDLYGLSTRSMLEWPVLPIVEDAIWRQELLQEFSVPLRPFFSSICYTYDVFDCWRVRLSLENVYFADGVIPATSNTSPAAIASASPNWVGQLGGDVTPALQEKLNSVHTLGRPLCIAADGVRVMEHSGNVAGYLNVLRSLKHKDACYQENREWVDNLGWTGRKIKPANLL